MKVKLPQELINAIIEECREDRDSLLVFSLVGRTCLRSSQRHLFRSITLYAKAPTERLSRTEQLGQLLITSPHLSDYIQWLVLLPSDHSEPNFLETEKALPLLLRKLSNLRRIAIYSLWWTTITLDLQQALHCVLMRPSIDYVKIKLARFDRMDELAYLLYAAKGLKDLSLDDIEILGPRQSLELWTLKEDVRDERTHLSGLQLCMGDYSVLFALLLGPRSPWKVSQIHNLHIMAPDSAHGDDVNRLFWTIGSSLKRLRLDMKHQYWLREHGWEVNVEFNSNIRSLCLANLHISSTAFTALSTRLQRFFSNVKTSNRLAQLQLELLFIDDPDDPEEVPADWSAWNPVDRVLAGTNFGFLRTLEIDISSEVAHEPDLVHEICNQVVAMNPLLVERGVSVTVQYGDVRVASCHDAQY
ncbi:hypothetical protein JB92DRAFT_3142515 [Gautieria morchelliformis]|nr:hypothetical protein JB92DRAFT_3142515 [Gautieria morchelliformis]